MPTATKDKKRRKAKAPTIEVTHADFDSMEPFRLVRDAVPISEFETLTYADYEPRGSTPLLDATASMIGHLDAHQKEGVVTIGLLLDRSSSMGPNRESVVAGVNEFVSSMADVESVDPDAAGKVLCVVVTDGLENNSQEATRESVAKLTSAREQRGWTFIYLGANQDAWGEASHMGYSGGATGQSSGYQSTPKGMRAALSNVANRGVGYVGNHGSYMMASASLGETNLAEDGTEVDKHGNLVDRSTPSAPKTTPSNTGIVPPQGQPPTGITSPTGPPKGQPNSGYGDVGDAIKKARSTTEGKE